MLQKLFVRKIVNIVDGDNRAGASPTDLKNKLVNMINSGMEIRGVQLFHHAAIHYSTRWDNYTGRFLNALINSVSTLNSNGTYLSLNNKEEHELQGNSSEVLGIGLSNYFMCKWYGVNINKIEKIGGTSKRCDYRFGYNGSAIIFESKGRAASSQIKSALQDCLLKKLQYSGNVKYSTICHLPRDSSPITLHLYDPPVFKDGVHYNEFYAIAKHYRKITELSGLTILSSMIDERIIQYEQTGEWNTNALDQSNIYKIGINIQIGNNTFWSRENPFYNSTFSQIENSSINELYIRFGIEKKVVESLERWDFLQLSEIHYDEFVSEEHGVSVLSDGSLFYIGQQNLTDVI
jgi:hypothetical protein